MNVYARWNKIDLLRSKRDRLRSKIDLFIYMNIQARWNEVFASAKTINLKNSGSNSPYTYEHTCKMKRTVLCQLSRCRNHVNTKPLNPKPELFSCCSHGSGRLRTECCGPLLHCKLSFFLKLSRFRVTSHVLWRCNESRIDLLRCKRDLLRCLCRVLWRCNQDT